MNLQKIIELIQQRFTYGSRIHPSRDWFALLALVGILFAGIVGWNMWAFDTVAQGGVIGAPATTTVPVFSQSSLDAIHKIFANRVAEELKYTTGVYRFADPSQ